MGKDYHVVPSDDGWKVRRAGTDRAASIHRTQNAAINRAIPLAKRESSEVVIHGRDGKIRDKDSYGNDPCPPKDRKN